MTIPDIGAIAPPLAVLVCAGVGAALVAALATRVFAQSTFALRAALLQSCIVVLLIVSLAALLPRAVVRRDVFDRPAPSTATTLTAASTVIAESPRRAMVQRSLERLVVAVWLVGALVGLGRIAVGALQLAAVRSRAPRSSRHPVLVSDEVDVPFVHGWRRPAIVVPSTSESWSADTWHAVLIHEGAHVARGDVLMLWIRQITLALHWFNPAVRWLMHRADEACEGACDDIVVLHGGVPAQYAGTLVSFAEAAWPYASAPAMAARTGLEHRVAAIMDRGRARRGAQRRDLLLPLLFGALGGLALALVVPRPAIALTRNLENARERLPQPTPQARPNAAIAPRMRPQPASRSQARITNDTTEALLGLGQLLDDTNPIVRQTASDALAAWGTKARVVLEPITRTGDPERSKRANRALAALGAGR